MDLESESSALESVDDNGLIQQSAIDIADDDDDDGRSLDNGSFSDESVKLVSTCTPITSAENETSVEPMSFGTYSPVSKGRGLRKWRRIRRDLVKDTPGNMENSKVLKRGLSGSAHSQGKQMQFQSPEVEQDSQGSVGSVNMFKNTSAGFEIFGSGYDSRFGFSVAEKDDDRSSKSSTAARVTKAIRYDKAVVSSGQRGNCQVENSKKHRGESVEIEKENSHSSLESDSRKQSGRMMDYNGENGDEADMHGETSNRNYDNAGGEGEESISKNNRFSEEVDPLAEAIDGFLTLQEAIEKEVQQFREIGKEPMPQHDQVSSPSSEIANLVNNVKQLEIKLQETRSMLEVKESHIRELESTTNHSWGGTETVVVENIFRERIEAEIEYLIYSTSSDSLNSQMKLVQEQESLAEEQAHETLNKLEQVETKAANLSKRRAQDLHHECRETTETIKKRACKMTSCFLIQLVLLLTAVLFFMSQFSPELENVVPT